MGFPRQEYWSGVPFPPQGDLPDPGMKPMSPAFAGRFFTTEPPGKPYCQISYTFIHSKFINTVSYLLFLCSCVVRTRKVLQIKTFILSFIFV